MARLAGALKLRIVGLVKLSRTAPAAARTIERGSNATR
jgi:hypothetical protein